MNMLSKLVLSVLCVGASVSWAAGAGRTIQGSFTSAAGTRSYSFYIPAVKATEPLKHEEQMPMFVMLHGCFMSGDQMATGTRLNEIADTKRFYVLYPEQTYADNSWKCWNWFKPENQKRSTGESSIIAGMTKKLMDEYKVDPKRIYIMGMSAGGAMATNILGCYSDIYAGAVIHSGMEYAAAKTEDEAHTVMSNGATQNLDASAKQMAECSPARKSLIPMIVFHGSADPFVKPINGERTASQITKLNQLIKPGTVLTQKKSKLEQENHKLSADVTDTLFDGQPVVRHVSILTMGHAWSGGAPTAPYMEPRGVDASTIAVDYLLNGR